MANRFNIVAIDPLSLLLPSDVYVKLNLPRPVEITKLNATQKKAVLKGIAEMRTFLDAAEKEAKTTTMAAGA